MSRIKTVEEFRAYKAKQRKAAKDAAISFVAALESGDPALLAESLEKLEDNPSGWSRALRVAAKLKEVHPESRLMMVRVLVVSGDAIRDHVDNDLLFCDALRNIVPPYQGGAVVLSRGESALARRLRVYGLSWSSDRCVADSYARIAGGVVLETFAPPEAIICVPHLCADNLCHDEGEYLVDRRRLGAVNVVQRYPQRVVTAGSGLSRKAQPQ